MSSEARITDVVHYLAWVLGTEPRSSGKATNALTVKPFPIYEQSIKIMAPQLNDPERAASQSVFIAFLLTELYFSVTI